MQQFGKKAHLTQQLMKENIALQQQIVEKDKDLIMVMKSLGEKKSEDLERLEDRMNELREVNGVQLQHLSTLQMEIEGKRSLHTDINLSIEEYKNSFLETRQRLAQTVEEEDHQTKMGAILKNSIESLAANIANLNHQEEVLSL